MATEFTGWRKWIGLPHELGADPRDGKGCCCLKLSQIVLAAAGYNPPQINDKWYVLSQQNRWDDAAKLFLEYVTEADPWTQWSIVPFCSPEMFGIGVVVQDQMVLTSHHRRGACVIPARALRSPEFFVLR